MDKGIYCLILANRQADLEIGSLGPVHFFEGWHIYVGSALGSGGLLRVLRHIGLYRLRDRQPRWHIDRLLLHPAFTLPYAVCAATKERLECDLAQALSGDRVPKFGCSDCSCRSHLFFRKIDPADEVAEAFKRLGLTARITTIKSERDKHTV
jgi:Uri superfamily endonuclease